MTSSQKSWLYSRLINIPTPLSIATSIAWLTLLFFWNTVSVARPLPDTLSLEHSSNNKPALSREPGLLWESPIQITESLFKKGLFGTALVEVNLDEFGKVEKCTITRSIHPIIDSLIFYSVTHSTYSPAIDSGNAVASTIRFELAFDPDSLLSRAVLSQPDIDGIVMDKETTAPIAGALVSIDFADLTQDTAITIGFNEYMKLIGKIPGQYLLHNRLTTATDSQGRFAFRQLPDSKLTIFVNADGYAITSKEILSTSSIQTTVTFGLKHFSLPEYSTIVYGSSISSDPDINLEKHQYSKGMVHSLSDVIKSQTTIRAVPASKSMMLVRSGGPFDNRYIICGVPFLIPFHFGSFPYGETDGVILSSLKTISLTVNRIAGRYPDVTGVLVEADPGIYRPAYYRLKKRPEISLDFGKLSSELMLSVPVQKKKNGYLQLGISFADVNLYRWMRNYYTLSSNSSVGIGFPRSYNNATLTSSNSFKKSTLESFFWFALDMYDSYTTTNKTISGVINDTWSPGGNGASIPWGMFSIGLRPISRQNPAISLGGSRQYYSTGKRVGSNAFLVKSYLENAICSFAFDTVTKANLITIFDGKILYSDWQTDLINQRSSSDTLINSTKQNEVEGSIHGYSYLPLGSLCLGTDLLLSTTLYDETIKMAFDPGFSVQYSRDAWQSGLYFGRVTCTPDIRGMPTPQFRREHLHAYLVSLSMIFQRRLLKIGVQPYLRLQDKTPQLDPLKSIWDTSKSSQLLAGGLDFDCEVKPYPWATLHCALNLADAKRYKDGLERPYEWNVPFTGRFGIHLAFFNELIHIYVDQTIQKGLPYYNFDNGQYESLSYYYPLDLSFQIRNKQIKHRYLTQYDGYVTVRDLLNESYIQNYYWNSGMYKTPIHAGGITFSIGLKAGFRL